MQTRNVEEQKKLSLLRISLTHFYTQWGGTRGVCTPSGTLYGEVWSTVVIYFSVTRAKFYSAISLKDLLESVDVDDLISVEDFNRQTVKILENFFK